MFTQVAWLILVSEANAQEKKSILKNVGMACKKVCKQGRDDVKVKVNIQSLIPASFPH